MSVLDLPPVHVGGEAPAWEGAGTARELLNAFMAAPGPGSGSGAGVERPAAAAGAVGDGKGDLDWPVHAPPAGKGVGAPGAEVGAGGGSSDHGVAGSAASSADPERAKTNTEKNTETTSTVAKIDIRVDTQSTNPATSSNPASAQPAPELGTSSPKNTAVSPNDTGGNQAEQDTTVAATSTGPSLLGAQLVTPAPPGGGNPNGVDWLDFLSGAAAEANAVGEWVAGRGGADAAKAPTAPKSGGGPPGESSGAGEAGAAPGGESAGMAVDMDADADAEDENAEDAEGEPDIEEDEGEMDIQGEPLREQGVAASATAADADSNSSSSAAEVQVQVQVESASPGPTSSPDDGGKTTEEQMKVDAGATTTRDAARGPLEDHVTKSEAGNAMAVDGAV